MKRDNVLGDGIGSVEIVGPYAAIPKLEAILDLADRDMFGAKGLDVMTRVQEILADLSGDLLCVNGARASYGKRKAELDAKDVALLDRLGDKIHHTPLRHMYVSLVVKAPEFVGRQWYKHVVGSSYGFDIGPSFPDMPWSEFSQRFATAMPEVYVPTEPRGQSTQDKQQSADNLDAPSKLALAVMYDEAARTDRERYARALELGASKEEARLLLGFGQYTQWQWTASLQAIVHFVALRREPHAQYQTQLYAAAVQEMVEPLAPETFRALLEAHPLSLKARIAELEAERVAERKTGERAVCAALAEIKALKAELAACYKEIGCGDEDGLLERTEESDT